MDYSELQITSNFSFLRGASHPNELVDQAAVLGYKKVAITDRNTMAGIVRAHVAAKEKNISLFLLADWICWMDPAYWLIRRIKKPMVDCRLY